MAALLDGSEKESAIDGAEQDFHLAVYQSARNSELGEIGRRIHSQLQLVRAMSGTSGPRNKEADFEHRSIFAAIAAGNIAKAAQLMEQHCASAGHHIVEMLAAQ